MPPKLALLLAVSISCVACSGGANNGTDNNGSTSDAGDNADTGPPLDFTTNPDVAAPTWTLIRLEDQTRPGEGLPLDAVEVCLLDGSNCVPMTVVEATSDPDLDFAGVQDGATAQDDTCTESSYTELGPGNWVILGFDDPDQTIDGTSKINVWIGASACSLIPPGDKPVAISIGNDAGAPSTFTELETCQGTCTVSP